MKLYITQALMFVMILASAFCGSIYIHEPSPDKLNITFMLPTEDTSKGLRIELSMLEEQQHGVMDILSLLSALLTMTELLSLAQKTRDLSYGGLEKIQ